MSSTGHKEEKKKMRNEQKCCWWWRKWKSPIKRSYEGPESLLTCWIPNLKFGSRSSNLDGFDFEINTNISEKLSAKGK
jgi:hypothetical protein